MQERPDTDARPETLPAEATPAPPPRWVVWLAHATLRAPRLSPLRLAQGPLTAAARQMGATYEHIEADDGTRIHVGYLPPAEQVEPRTPVLFTHGYLETKEQHLARLKRLHRAGHGVVYFDLRAHGRSGGKHTSFGHHEHRDAGRVLDLAQNRGWVGHEVVSIGYSTGATVLLRHAQQDPRVAGVVALSPFSELRYAVMSFRQRIAPWLVDEQRLLNAFEIAARDLAFDFDAAACIEPMRAMDKPVLLVVGDRDIHLPPPTHARVIAACNRARCRLHTVPGADHISLVYRRWPGLDQTILDFCAGPDRD